MTKDEAAALLGTDRDAAASAVRQRYEELHNDYHVRLTNAPTTALKKAYQRNLQELEEACRVLIPGYTASTPDLPTTEPTAPGPREDHRRIPQPTAAPQVRTTPGTPDGGISPATRWGITAAAVGLALATMFGLLWQREARANTQLGQELAGAQATITRLTATNDVLQQLLKTAPLKICNESSRPVRITSAVAVYAESTGAVRAVYSGSYNYPSWEVRPGGRVTLDIMRGGRDDWDGTAALYSLLVEYPGMEPYLVAGLMSNHKNGCVNLALD